MKYESKDLPTLKRLSYLYGRYSDYLMACIRKGDYSVLAFEDFSRCEWDAAVIRAAMAALPEQ